MTPISLPLWTLAPAKVNLGLFVGPARDDGKHELVSVMQSISLADELTLSWASGGALEDELDCPGVPGPAEENLAFQALLTFRQATSWDAPPLKLTVLKRVPVAAGLGGGSGDAAAALRLAKHASGLGDEELLGEIASRLGADVASQIRPGRWLARGAGEHLQELPDPEPPLGVLVLALDHGLSTAQVYSALDAQGSLRTPGELDAYAASMAQEPLQGELLQNDLQAVALSLCPEIGESLAQLREVGATSAFVSGSGPTAVGLFASRDGAAEARRAAATLSARRPSPMAAVSVGASFAAVRPLTASQ